MVKIIIKEPVSGVIGPGPTAARQSLYVMVVDNLENVHMNMNSDKMRSIPARQAVWDKMANKWLPNGLGVSVPIENIAFALEWNANVGP